MLDLSFRFLRVPRPISPQRLSSRALLLVMLVAFGLLSVLAAEEWLSIRHLSITVDEGAHLYAGYEHWTKRDFGVNPEHPPLVKLVAAAPLLGLHLQQPHPPSFLFIVEEYMGGSQLYDTNNGELLLRRARIAASLFTLLLALLVFAAGYEIFGPPVALAALALFTFEPTVLAHGALVTTDMGVACFLFAAFYTFYRFLKQPGLLRLLLCGLAVGLALAAKISGVLALPILILFALTDLAFTHAGRAKRTRMLLASLLAIFVVGYVVLWGFYSFRYTARPGDLSLAPPLAPFTHTLPHPWQARLILQLAAWHLLPEAYLYGWTKVIGNSIGFPGFLFGHLYPAGTWIYFPAALLIKSSLSLLILLAVSPFVLKRFGRETYLPSVGLALALATILLFSMSSRLDIGVRHVLALFPFAVVLAAAGAWALATISRIAAVAVAALLLYQCISSLHSYPDYLPYANEAFGGSSKTYRLLSDSNVDWGQQLKEVSAYLRSHHTSECWLAYSNMSIAPQTLPCKALPTGLAIVARQPVPLVPERIQGTILISGLDASGALWGPGNLNPYRQFQDGHPVDMIGNSILVYRGTYDIPLASAETHMSQVPTLLRMHRTDAALGEAKTALAIDPQSPMLQGAMGSIYLQLGRGEEARQAFAKAMQLAREHQTAGEPSAVAHQIARLTAPAF